jgi:hypothetical protein
VSPPDIVALLRRHLIAVLVVCAVVGGYGYHVIHKNPGYVDAATVGFVGPRAGGSVFSNYRGLLSTEEATAWFMMGPQGEQEVRAAGGTTDYNVALSNSFNEEYPDYSTPYVDVTTTSLDPTAAANTFTAVMKVLTTSLAAQQRREGARSQSEITTVMAAAPTGPRSQGGSHKRSLAALAVLMIIAVFLTASLLDRRRPRSRGLGIRSRRRSEGDRWNGNPRSMPQVSGH